MKRFQEYFKLKDYKIENPDVYHGSTVYKMNLESDKYCWTISPKQYVRPKMLKRTSPGVGRDFPRNASCRSRLIMFLD